MAADHLQFLKNKFTSDFEEAEAEEFIEFPLRLHFVEILEVLHRKWITSSTPIGLKDSLYDLKFALADCVMLAEKERDRITQNKKSLLGSHYVKKQWFLFQTKRKLLRIKKELLQHMSDVDVADERPTFLSSVKVCQPTDFPNFDLTLIHGFHRHLRKMEALLVGRFATDNFRAIGIVGMGGSGKTTLAQMVFHSARVQKSFSPMLWVELPQYPDLKCIVLSILKCLASDFSWSGSTGDINHLLHNMHLHLLKKKYLIVLDNMWHASDDWYLDGLYFNSKLQMYGENNYTHLSHGLPRGSGGAIIVTSRLKELASKMVGEQNLHELEPVLDKESCWRIIQDSIREKNGYHWILRKMKDDMVDRCDGLPLAAKTLADIVSTKFLKDPTAIKMFHLVLNKRVAPTLEVLKELKIYSGVYYADIVSDQNNEVEVEVGGSCDPKKVVEDLKKIFQVEITQKIVDNNNSRRRKKNRKLIPLERYLAKSNSWI